MVIHNSIEPGMAAAGTAMRPFLKPFLVLLACFLMSISVLAQTLTSISPNSGQTAINPFTSFTLTASGSGFVSGSVIRWNGTVQTTTFVNGTTLRASIVAGLYSFPGTAQVTVSNPGGGTSSSQTFTILADDPTISEISPTSRIAGGPDFTLSVQGGTFYTGLTQLKWNGVAMPTSVSSVNALSATIPMENIATAGTARITVFNPAPGGGTSNTLTFTINNRAPTLSSINANSAMVGGPSFTLTATGTNFNSSSKVRWNGADLATTLVSFSSLTATVPAANIATAGTASVTVFMPAPGGGTSAALTFSINNPAPVLASISPNSANTGGAAFTLTATGSDFVSSSVLRWNGVDLATTFVSATSLTASVPAANIAVGGTFPITVFTPNGGGSSAPQMFTTNNPAPTLTSLTPTSTPAGNGDTVVQATGTNFVSDSVVRWNGADLATTFVSSTSLTAVIPGANIASPGTASVTVFNPAPSGGTSGAQTFTFNAGTPILTSISPATTFAGGPSFTLTVTGSRFIPGASIRWSATPLTTTYVNSTTLTAVVNSALISNASTVPIRVSNPGGPSNSSAINLQIDNAAPVLNSLSPSSGLRGGAAFTLTVTGSGFALASIVKWNGSNLTTTFVNNTTLTATVPAANLSSAGNRTVTVFNPTPGGGTSAGQTFVVNNKVPVLTSLSPDSAIVGASSASIVLTGTNFVSGAVVRWNGADLPTTFVNTTQLSVTVPGANLATVGIAAVDVINPAPTTGPSNSLPFEVRNPVPTLTSVTPNVLQVFSPDTVVDVYGTNFDASTVANWNGVARATTFVSATQLKMTVLGSDTIIIGNYPVTVTSPAGTSNSVNIEVAGVVLTQTVTLSEHTQPDQPITVEIRNAGSTVALQTLTPTLVGGSYSITVSLAPGTYDIAVSGSTWLRKVIASVVVSGSTTTIPAVSLVNGDCDGNNVIDLSDYTIVALAFNALPGDANWDPRADLNGDGVVDLTDYTIVAVGFNAIGD